MFSKEHFIWIGICVLIIGLLLYFALKFKWNKKTALLIMCGVSIASELVKVFTHINPVTGIDGDWSEGGVIEAGALPLHLCSIFIFIFFFLAFNKNEKLEKKIISFFVPIGLVGAMIAILMATSGVNFAAPYAYQCFIYHSVMVWLALYYICTKQVELGLKAYLRNLVILLCLGIVMIWINGMLQSYDTNFFFVVRPPADNLPILNLNHGWFVYFVHLAICAVILETVVCLPYILKERKNENI